MTSLKIPMPLPVGATIGILGDGQLGRMLSQSAARLGFKVAIYGPDPASPAAEVSSLSFVGDYDDQAALARFAAVCDVISFEFENIPVSCLAYLKSLGAHIFPNPEALGVTQDRIAEKQFARSLGIETVEFAEINTASDLDKAIITIGLPALLKTRREGYDGKGQAWVKTPEDAALAFSALGDKPAILEAKADFVREISVIAARGQDGDIRVYPVGENHHRDGILSTTVAPAKVTQDQQAKAVSIGRQILDALDYVGVLAVELFVMNEGGLWLNEIAPRVHNTGHWTQDGCLCDQFEQHIRAICGWPLGDTYAHTKIEMTNLLGEAVLEAQILAGEPKARLYIYGKGAPKPGRKMGHVNRVMG
jgi:5-(carboxyamino)imidazole ribonucleotide synthase